MSVQSAVIKVVGAILFQLVATEKRRLEREINRIVAENKEHIRSSADWFLYQGKVYTSTAATLLPGGAGGFPQLAMALNREMEAYIRDQKEVEQDQTMIKQILVTLLQGCGSSQEIRDTLPSFLLPLTPDYIKQLGARFAEGFFAPKHERFVSQYQRMLPKMEFYSATRLLY